MRPLERAAIDAVLRPIDRARPFPRAAYVDDDVFAFESRAALGRAWICVGREDEVVRPGQWLREEVGGEPILVVRGADLRLRAFFDVCRHRGASIVGRAACGRAARIECPYHGWTYELDGRLAAAPFAAPKDADLRPLEVGTWRGFVFVKLDPGGETLDAWAADAPPWLDDDALGALRLGRRTSWETAANWKFCVENFQESHHFPRIHRALEHLTPAREADSWIGRGRWLGGTMDIEGAETVSSDGSRHDRPLLGAPRTRVCDAMLFPSLLTSLQPDYLLVYRLAPLAAGRTRVTFEVHFHPAAFVAGFDPRDVYDFWDRVNAEDRAICEDQQKSAASRAFDPTCYATVEEGMHAFDRMVAALHAAAEES